MDFKAMRNRISERGQRAIEAFKACGFNMKKKGMKFNTNMINTAILGFVGIVVLFKLYATLMPEAQAAGDELNATGVPLGSFFTGGGIVWIIIMAALVILIVKQFTGGKK